MPLALMPLVNRVARAALVRGGARSGMVEVQGHGVHLIPTSVQPSARSQSRIASRSRVTVRNVLTSFLGFWSALPINRHATTVA